MADFVEIAGPEEHKQRLECCKRVLRTFFHREMEQNFESDHFDELFVFVTDVWSVIRKECAKELAQSYSTMLEAKQKLLLVTLDLNFANAINDNLVWQKLDGCLLAYNAIISYIYDNLLLYSLSIRCFDLLGHMRIPIRDTAAELLIKLATKSFDRRKAITDDTLTTIHALITSQVMETEQVVVKLGCLLSVYDSIAVQHHQATVIQEESLTLLYTCLASCMTHNASTVRQQAGHLLSNLLKSVENADKLEQLIETVLQPALQSSQPWTFAESALIVLEEVLRSIICIQSKQRLIQVLDSLWDDLMAHERFEVRRVILQLLPIFCRTLLLHSSDVYNLNLAGNNVESESGLSLLLRACRLSALLREHRLLEECLSTTSRLHLKDATEPWIAVEQLWGSEPRGRLQEAEQQMLFKSYLLTQATNTTEPANRQALMQQMIIFDKDLVHSITEVFKEVNQAHKHGKDILIALDLPELWALATCFLQSITTRTAMNDQLLELKQQLEQARGSMIQVLTSLQQLSGTSSSSGFMYNEGQVESYSAILPPVSDPATNPSLYARHHQSAVSTLSAVAAADEASNSTTATAAVSAIIATFSPPVTPSKPQRFSSPYGSTGAMMNSSSLSVPKSPAPPSPNNLGPNCSLALPSPPYSALDRWMCEAIAPLLPCLCQSVREHALLVIVIGWTKRTLTDPLWLDGRKFGKTALYDSLLLLSSSVDEDSGEMMVQELLEVLNVAVMIPAATAGDVLRIILIILKCIYTIVNKAMEVAGVLTMSMKELEETLEVVRSKVQTNNASSSQDSTTAREEEVDEDEFSDWDDDEDDDNLTGTMKTKAGSGGVSSANAMADAIIEIIENISLLVLK